MIRRYLVIVILVALLPRLSFAADVNCSSTSAVQTAINAASSGDTLICTAGGTWSSTVTIPNTKGVTLYGNGKTIIRQNVGNAALINLAEHTTAGSRITGFNFTDRSSSFQGYSAVFIKVSGSPTTSPSRVDNNTFTVESPYCGRITQHIKVTGQPRSLIDNNTFRFSTASEVIHNEAYGTGSDTGWTYDVSPGSSNALYVENNNFIAESTCYWLSAGKIYAGANSALQTYYGARTVFRHNNIWHAKVDQHGTAGMVGGRWLEAYENKFYGVDPYAGNTGSIDTLFAMRGGSGVIFNNTYTVNGNACNTGAKNYEEDTGTYPLAYQPGRGKLTGSTFALDPIRIWSNTFTGCTSASSGNAYVVENRDYYYSADATDARAGYSAYTYPHPLTGVSIPPAPVLTSPANFASITTPVTFQWEAVSGATNYNLEIDDTSNFSSPVVDIETTNTSYTVSVGILSPATTYYWRVRAYK